MKALLVLVALLTLTAACSSSVSETTESRTGIIIPWGRDTARVTLQVDGNQVAVTVMTYGDECYSKGETVIARSGSVAEVTPVDVRTIRPGRQCADIRREFEHVANVTFDEPRPWTILVRGIDVQVDEVVTITRVIQ